MHAPTLLSLALASITANARSCTRAPSLSIGVVKCPLIFDGRVAAAAATTDFDSYGTSKFNADYVKGKELKWSDIIKFPADAGSARFDTDAHKAFEVTISDKSIFQTQNGFRRAGLQFQGDTNTGSPASAGVKTLHFSLKWDAQRALNLSHEYLVSSPFFSLCVRGVMYADGDIERLARGGRLLVQPVQLPGRPNHRPVGPDRDVEAARPQEQAAVVDAH